ncbi:MAG: ABC transporter substrate-binding protein [Elusimicrobia bacterium]|nr:ABC transporter substrate-binding protein [Elusimicrobiota bacterium]
MTRRDIGVCGAAAFLLAASVAWTETGVMDKEILIGSCAVLDGPTKFLGTETVRGAKLYFDHINSQGGVNGRKLKLDSNDDGYEPDKAINCFKKLESDGVFAAGFFVGTPTAAKYAPMAKTAKIPILGFFTGAQLLREPFQRYIINVRASYYDEAKEQVDHLYDAGAPKIAVLYQNDAFGNAVLEGVKKAMKAHGAEPVALGSFPRGTLDVDEGIKSVKSAKPDAVVLVGPYAPLAEIVKRAKAGGFSPLFTTVSFVGTEAFIKASGKDGEGTVITQVVPPPDRTDLKTVALYRKLLKEKEKDAEPNFVSLEGFVDAMVMVDGLRKAGKDLTREGFIDAIETIKDLDMGLGKNLMISYGPDDHEGFKQLYPTVVKDGKAVVFTDWKSVLPK